MPFKGNEKKNTTFHLITKREAHVAFVNQAGDSMSGILNMQLNRITNLPTPGELTDAANKNYVDSRTRVYGFQLQKRLLGIREVQSSTDNNTLITITVPNGIHPDQVMFTTSHRYLDFIVYRSFSETSTYRNTKVQFTLAFLRPPESITITLEGLIHILPRNYISLSSNNIQLTLENDILSSSSSSS